MKNYFLLSFICLILSNGLFAQFTPGRLVVYQAGKTDGSETLANTGNTIVLREFTTSGTAGTSLALPTSGSNAIVSSGSATSEGSISRSEDGNSIVAVGYNTINGIPNTSSISGATSSSINRIIGTIDYRAIYAQAYTTNSFFSTNNIRSAVSDGTNFWVGGGNSGVVLFNSANPNGLAVSTTNTNNRSLGIFNNQLYSSASTAISVVGSGLPTGSTTANSLISIASGSAYNFSFSPGSIANGSICYIADDRASALGGILKYTYNGSSWSLAYTLGTGVSNIGARGIVVDYSGTNPIIYATSAEASANRIFTITDAGSGSSATTIFTAPTGTAFRGIAFTPGCLWKGSTNTSWTTSTNWTFGMVPVSTTSNIIIPSSATNFPVLTNNVNLNNLTSNGTITINNGVILTLTGSFNNAGVIVNNGTITAPSGGVIFNSTSTNTGMLANSSGTFTNNVTVQRFIPAKTARKWTFLASPVGGVKLNSTQGWQQQMHITGAGTGGTNCVDAVSGNQPTQHTNGFDATVAAQNSFFYYDAATSGLRWTPISATNGTTATSGTLQVGMGYRANIRGTRAQGCALLNAANPPAPDAVTLSTTGTITIGNVAINLPTGFSLIGNPYPATIDWNNTDWQTLRTTNNIANTYYIYSPANASSVYTTYNGTIITNAGGLTNGNLIASGQAFFVERTAGSGAISNFFQEGFKTASTQNGVFRTNQANQIQSQIRVGLKTALDTAHIDEVVIAFSNDAAINKNFSSQFDSKTINDAPQMIASVKENTQTAIQQRPINTTNDTVKLFVKSNTNAAFILQCTEHTNMPGEIILRDKFLNTTQDVKVNALYNFNVTTDPLSQGGERFELVFRSASTLPVQFVTVNAEKKAVGAQVNFTVAKDEEAKNYVVERSNGNANFTAVATIDSKNQTGNVSYTAIDNQAIQGTVLYRVKANSKNGGYVYSPTVKLAGDKGAVQLTLYPNPVKETLNIQTEGAVAGKVSIRIVNQLGEVMQTLNNVVISNSQVSINVAKLPAGVYHVSISNGADYTAKGSFVK